ncbi:glycoside hydrolase family 19 protein [Microcystis sp. M046S1]|jgi:predicted chitinase|uniref:glycoside hydrolase family 19 protein n=1 Tax=Microcystis sp. M046S1 TaxID=2771118 RepID=UPI00258F0EDA|nr:glycoside hydrolase family 19 protein [Microcystis sp. M046S1]
MTVTLSGIRKDDLSQIEEQYAFDILINLPILKFDQLKSLMKLSDPGVLGPTTLKTFVALCKDRGFDLSLNGVNNFKNSHKLGNTGNLEGVIGAQTAAVYFDKIISGGGKVDRDEFFTAFESQFNRQLTASQKQGYNAIFDYWDKSNLDDNRWLAYVLATAFHETGEDMQPVREGFASTDQGSINAVTSLYNRGIIGENYALPEANGKSYFGRGLVQITWGDNYKKLGQAIGIGNQLYDNPSLALNMEVAVKILFVGMVDGLYAPVHSLRKYFFEDRTDWVNARRIINWLDKADLVAGYGQKFFKCLS